MRKNVLTRLLVGVSLLFMVGLMLSGCGLTGETREERAARQVREAQYVRDALEAGEFTIDISQMIPMRMSPRQVSPYSVRLSERKLYSHLPYMGRAWEVPYGGGHALNFKAPIVHYEYGMNRKGGYEILIYVKTDEDEHIYSLTVFDNGSASLDVQSRNRERISYTGTVDFLAE
jgi:hypothetical protein